MICVSTTYYDAKRSDLHKVLTQLNKLDIDGIEIGSTHTYKKKKELEKIFRNFKGKELFIHNFFPPKKNENFVLNIASKEKKIRDQSVDFIIESIEFSKKVGAKLYTFHPGFLSDAQPNMILKNKNYDFKFNDKVSSKKVANQMLIKSLRKIINHSKAKKMKIALETEGSRLKYNYLMMQRPNEFVELFRIFPNNLFINLNISHSSFASKVFNFSLINFIKKFKKKVAAVELSCNDGFHDQHLPIKSDSENLKYLKYFKNTPIILEFRNTNFKNIKKSIEVLKKNLQND